MFIFHLEPGWGELIFALAAVGHKKHHGEQYGVWCFQFPFDSTSWAQYRIVHRLRMIVIMIKMRLMHPKKKLDGGGNVVVVPWDLTLANVL